MAALLHTRGQRLGIRGRWAGSRQSSAKAMAAPQGRQYTQARREGACKAGQHCDRVRHLIGLEKAGGQWDETNQAVRGGGLTGRGRFEEGDASDRP